MNFIEMKEAIKPLLEQFCGVSGECEPSYFLAASMQGTAMNCSTTYPPYSKYCKTKNTKSCCSIYLNILNDKE